MMALSPTKMHRRSDQARPADVTVDHYPRLVVTVTVMVGYAVKNAVNFMIDFRVSDGKKLEVNHIFVIFCIIAYLRQLPAHSKVAVLTHEAWWLPQCHIEPFSRSTRCICFSSYSEFLI